MRGNCYGFNVCVEVGVRRAPRGEAGLCPTCQVRAGLLKAHRVEVGLLETCRAEAGVLGPPALQTYAYGDINLGERAAFVACVEEYLLDDHATTVKVNVAWDESDYQIDVATEDGSIHTPYSRTMKGTFRG